MNIYTRKQRWKILLLLFAAAISILSLWYTNRLVKQLSEEEKKKVLLWAEATKQLASTNPGNDNFVFALEVVSNNTTVPLILTDETGKITSFRNLDSIKAKDPEYLQDQLLAMKKVHSPIIITYEIDPENHIFSKNFIYYKNSILLVKLRYYPFFQLGIIALFLTVSYLAFSTSRKAEQNQVWVGMAKETAHQLGTPLSSLIAWVEYLKLKGHYDEMTIEIQKDIARLNTITERFSKIGSAPVLKKEDLAIVLRNAMDYMKTRSSSKIQFLFNYNQDQKYEVDINIPLFEWVIENLTKNAIDSISGPGSIIVTIMRGDQNVIIDISDTGKGIAKTKFKTIFNPGYTTKSRGWGLGLTLAKRIIEEYHDGQIFVKDSETNKGTTFRIVLKRSA